MAKFSMIEALNQVREQDKDHEISMARGELEAIADKATQLSSALDGKSDDGNPLEAWVQSKITKAKDYINSVSDYMMYKPEAVTEAYASHLIAKAKEIAHRMANDMSGAVQKIEKLSKGLSNDPSVLSALQKANEDIEWVDENKISDIFKSNKEGESIDDIAKRLKLSKSMVKRLMGEAQEEPKKVEDEKDNAEMKNKEAAIASLKDQITLLKQKLENEKHKAVKPEPNPQTGEVPLTIGVAHAEFTKEKDKKEKEVKENVSIKAYKNAVDPTKKGLMISKSGGMSGTIMIKDKKELKQLEDKIAQAKKLYNIKETKKEDLDNKDKPTVKDVIGQLKGAVKAHTKQAKDLEKALKTEGIKPYVSMQKGKDGKMNYVVLDKDEKEAFRSTDQRLAQDYWKKNFDKLKENKLVNEKLMNEISDKLKMKVAIQKSKNLGKKIKQYKDKVFKKTMSTIQSPLFASKDKEKAAREKRAKDMIKYYDAQKKAALQGKNKELAKKMLKNEVEHDIKLDEFTSNMIKRLQISYADLKGKTMSPEKATALSKHLDRLDTTSLRQLVKANIPFITSLARNKIYKKTGKFEEMRLRVEAMAGLQKKADKSGMSYSILKQVYNRGMAAWKSGHRPGASQQQWAYARVNSFITKSSGTWGGADKDLAAKVKGSK